MLVRLRRKHEPPKGNIISQFKTERGTTIKILDTYTAGKTIEERLAEVNKRGRFKFTYTGEPTTAP